MKIMFEQKSVFIFKYVTYPVTFQKLFTAGHQYLTPGILAIQEVEIRKI
jgi:hypothetical protein